LQIVDRGYVLDQGTNAYEGTGKSLSTDPKVIELYLGTLAKYFSYRHFYKEEGPPVIRGAFSYFLELVTRPQEHHQK
jgi:hypothetical protein